VTSSLAVTTEQAMARHARGRQRGASAHSTSRRRTLASGPIVQRRVAATLGGHVAHHAPGSDALSRNGPHSLA
jgi:hypothetical protein